MENTPKNMAKTGASSVSTEMQKIKGFVCCLCNEWSLGWGDNQQYGNNPSPLKTEGECCDKCDRTKVIPARLERMGVGN